MRLIGLAVVLAVSLALAPLAAEAQQASKVYRIGVLLTNSQAAHANHVEAFRQGLRERGYVEGQNIVIEWRYGDGKLDRQSKLATELVDLNVDLILTSGTQSTRAARQATGTIPIVMTVVGDPIAGGFIASLAKPGGNITGLSQMSTELGAKRLELLREAFPKVSRVAYFVEPTAQGGSGASQQSTQMTAETLGVKLLVLELRGPNPDLEGAFRTATSERVGALLIAAGATPALHGKRVVELAAKSRLPAMYASSEYVDLGGLMSYAPSISDLYRRAATHVDKILKGAKPADLPVEQPSKFELVINLKTAKTLGLTIPQTLLLRADHVIE